ncbi:MAG: aspartate kinase [Bdellovibrionales bacterium]|nr:aspartate kinase [Bdellovibrionales bacterium]
MNPVRVYKFGGASLENVDKLKSIAAFLAREKQINNQPILAVVSAMGKTTDGLISLAHEVSPHPQRRELDMLISVGERISMSLLSLALHTHKLPAISFTGSQAGIITDTSHGNARIVSLRPHRIETHLEKGDIVVLAGFQGVAESTKEITTLGRGGTDTTAVAMASYFKSSSCEFKKDVGGLYSADPKLVPDAKPLPQLTYRQLIDMTFWGANVLHHRAAELASMLKVPLRFSQFESADKKSPNQTLVSGDVSMFEEKKIIAINSHKTVHRIMFAKKDMNESLAVIQGFVEKDLMANPQILTTENSTEGTIIFCVGNIDPLTTAPGVQTQSYSSVTATCHGAASSDLLQTAMKSLSEIKVQKILQDSTNMTFIVNATERETAIQKLHSLIN